jgi:hypothetical protein
MMPTGVESVGLKRRVLKRSRTPRQQSPQTAENEIANELQGRGRRNAMNDAFEKKVRAAAVAGWWVLLIAYALLLVTWIAYLGLVSARPAWLLMMWGQDVTWDFLQTVSLWYMGVFKLSIWLLFLVVLWLTMWARQLRKLDQQGTKRP